MSKGDISIRARSARTMTRLEKLATATGKTVNQLLGELGDVIAELPPTPSAYYHALARILEGKPAKTDKGENRP